MIRMDDGQDWQLVDRSGSNEDGSLDFSDGVDVVLDDGFDDGVLECVGGSQDDVQRGRLDGEGARARQGVEQVERAVPLRLLGVHVQGLGGDLREDVVGVHGPHETRLDDGSTDGAVVVELVKVLIQPGGDLGIIFDHRIDRQLESVC